MTLRRLTAFLAVSLVAALAAASPAVPPEDFSALHWRLAGPLRAGWGTCAAGMPGALETFYFGTADGGVWKTTDAGRTWNPLFEREATGSIGALATTPAHPQVLWVGTGQVTTRWDGTSGNGVYRSLDGGATWEHRGLADSRHIGRVWIDPRNPGVVLVAALGHVFGPNAERGVFRTTDGGTSWEKVLFVDADTGATDLGVDPAAPDTVFAAFWQVRGRPWLSYFVPNVGPGSGIFKSADGGKSWARLTGHGLPDGPLGRIGLAVAPGSGGARVYATIDGGAAPGLYRSDDAGANWRRVNPSASLSGAYFATLAVDPKNPDTVWVMGQSLQRSTDGGTSFTVVRGSPGGDDYHFLWIDPDHPERMITAADQGTIVTVNGGASWSSWYNQPTGQFYHLATDDRFPYWIYSGQQDNGTVAVASRSDYGQLTYRDWHPVGGDERDYDIPFPGDPDVVYGTGLGGRLSRWDARTGQVQNVAPWPVSSYGQRPGTARYRTSWITPLAISLVPPHAIYLGTQVLFRSEDGGQSWATVSPDLTGIVPGLPGCTGDVPAGRARACGYGTISTIAPSPREKDVVWVGTDSGRIQRTADGGKSWQDVTPRGLADWSRVAQIDASPHDAATAYAAVDRHRLDDLHPSVYVTHDAGKSWRPAAAGLPEDAWVAVVRQDPVHAGLLFAGTSRGVHVSFDDGASWQPLQLDLPTSGVNDLTIHGADLIAATEGRAIWVLDDFTPLRHLGEGAPAPRLVPPATAFRVAANQNKDTPLPIDEPRTANPPAGAILDYLLPAQGGSPVTLEIADSRGTVVHRVRSDETPTPPEARIYFASAWLSPAAPLPARPGHNRYVWNLRAPRPQGADGDFSIAAVPGETAIVPQGLLVPPGSYEVRLTVDGRTLTQPLTVAMDPRSRATPADLAAQRDLYAEIAALLAQTAAARGEVGAAARLQGLDAGLVAAVERFRSGASDENLATVTDVLTAQAADLEGCDCAPTAPQREVAATYRKRLEAALAAWQALASKLPRP